MEICATFGCHCSKTQLKELSLRWDLPKPSMATSSCTMLQIWLNEWIDMFNHEKSIFEEPKVLLGNVPSSGERNVELNLVLAFTDFTNMKNFETDLAEDTFGAERAISTLVSASLPTAT
ncbi:uncharacterized protein LOC135343240 [Halichondria panicea]|uniref:uncharacterized protein LOC135343240 n=1 Tax=Halichondria panicea TaxID=6063 RepID=UPI00312BC75B